MELVESKKEIYLQNSSFFDYTDLIFINNNMLLCVCRKNIDQYSEIERGLVVWDIFSKTSQSIKNIKNLRYIGKK